ncbi:MAG: hypothetical protein E7254_02165 [Lachnospiraceae bacterium]|nr:hypothetical protein [Lachnospiraceae bacterium]
MKNKSDLILGIASVGFITQFGGGFASGVQIREFFMKYGIWAYIMPIVAQLIVAVVFGMVLKLAHKYRTFNYREFSDSVYGKYKFVLSNLYEIEYVVIVCLIVAVTFATGTAILGHLFGLGKGSCLIIVGALLFIMTIFGSDFIMNYSSVITVIILFALAIVLGPAIFSARDVLFEESAGLFKDFQGIEQADKVLSFMDAFKAAFIFAMFQIGTIGFMFPHIKEVKEEKEIKSAMVEMFVINTLVTELLVVGMIIASAIGSGNYQTVPILDLAIGQNQTIIGKLILFIVFIAAFTTGVNLLAGVVERFVWLIDTRLNVPAAKSTIFYILISLIFVFVAVLISEIGISNIVSTGYKYIGYATVVIVFIPIFVLRILNKFSKKSR